MTRTPGSLLVHPFALLALATWIINDHYAKAAHGNWLTGKLSDVTCLIVVPLIGIAVVELWRRRIASVRWSVICIVATGVVMITINLFEPAAWLYRYGLALAQWPLRAVHGLIASGAAPSIHPVKLTMDPTDLLTLPALLVPLWLVRASAISVACSVRIERAPANS
jgi:hypothetical protein